MSTFGMQLNFEIFFSTMKKLEVYYHGFSASNLSFFKIFLHPPPPNLTIIKSNFFTEFLNNYVLSSIYILEANVQYKFKTNSIAALGKIGVFELPVIKI